MTTAPKTTHDGHRPGVVGVGVRVPLLAGLTVTVVLGAALIAVGASVAGAPAATGAAIGLAMVCLFFGAGALVLAVVARIAPAASLLVALLTYTLNVVLVGLVFVGLNRSGALGEQVEPSWLAGTVIAGTLTWLTSQVIASMRTPQPVCDLPAAARSGKASPETPEQAPIPGAGPAPGGTPRAKEESAR